MCPQSAPFASSRYHALFISEATEHLAAMTAELVHLEQASRTGARTSTEVDELFRHLHSIKGMAASLDIEPVTTLAHRAEDLVGAFRGGRRPDPAAIDVLLATIDSLGGMIERVRASEMPEADGDLVLRLTAALTAPEPAAAAAAAKARIVNVIVRIAPSCPVPAVRGFLVTKRLERFGHIREAAPPLAALRAGQLPGDTLELKLETTASIADIEAILGHISDLSLVSVTGGAALDAATPPMASARPSHPGATAPAPAARPPVADTGRTVRVRADLLDTFLESIGELIVATARVREIARGVPEEQRPILDEGIDQLHTIVKSLHDQAMAVRMTPLSIVTGRLPRAVRDVARRTAKQVEVVIQGAEIEIDRAVLDELSEPLLHVIRNAVGHGIETPEQRRQAGKPETGKITVSARRDRDRVLLEIADDGRGMDAKGLREAAVKRGAISQGAADALPDADALLLACLPGVSTAETLTDVEGRGVGLDAVKRTVETLGGTLAVESTPGAGTRWTFKLPVSVAVQTVLLVRVGTEVLGIPVAKVHGAMQVAGLEESGDGRAPQVLVDGESVPLHDLGDVLGFGSVVKTALSSIVVAEEHGVRVGFLVDALLGQQEVVMRPLLRPFDQVAGLSAVTVLANGRPLFVLDVARLGGA